MFKVFFVTSFAVLVLALAAASQSAPTPTPPEFDEATRVSDAAEPITGAPAIPNPGDAIEVKDPFAPYGIGPAEEAITRDQLRPDERAAADRASNHDAQTLEKYRKAVLQKSASITAEAAARQLGVDNLKTVGVVP